MMMNESPALDPRAAIDALIADHDDRYNDLRELLIDSDTATLITDAATADQLDALINALSIDARSALELDLSLCPLHHCDYAICFDDRDPECFAIRTCFPSHDS
jgi:hypothetical protein